MVDWLGTKFCLSPLNLLWRVTSNSHDTRNVKFPMTDTVVEYIAAGGNRHPSAADWSTSFLAYGAGNNIALWNPQDGGRKGVYALLAGHTDSVNAVKIIEDSNRLLIVSGSADKTIRIWSPSSNETIEEIQCLKEDTASINAIATLSDANLFASGAADGTVKIWYLEDTIAKLAQTISLKPRFFPLCLALTRLASGDVVLAVAGSSNIIQLFACAHVEGSSFELQATLRGHEGWIRSLDFTREHQTGESDTLLASASQDKYIRLWRFRQGETRASGGVSEVNELVAGAEKISLSNKAHQVGSEGSKHSVTFEALLVGHEDWIYTARWAPNKTDTQSACLLTASADNSLSIWNAEPSSGLWVCSSRLGEISSQKGSTTATGSTGGFWIGLWQHDARSVVSLGRTGSWRRWSYQPDSDMWVQEVGIGGHVEEVRSLAWARSGQYLLSTSSDQTTRLYSQWQEQEKSKSSWHEFARPQIHGYDLNCVDCITDDRFISGADEKLLRVFDKPRAVDNLLAKLGGTATSGAADLPDAANIPVLGLSNKAVTAVDRQEQNGADGDIDEGETGGSASMTRENQSILNLEHPPFEDHLARHTLWPEHEKLYGHGYEISAVATSNDGTLVATACKASSLDHAVIRLYETKEWREVKPPLTAHSLTVTSLAFSPDDRYLLSVGRDRQWALFERESSASSVYTMHASNPKGHSRMILDCCWAPATVGQVFATAGRDKSVKIWRLLEGKAECISTYASTASLTAIAFEQRLQEGQLLLLAGDEVGKIILIRLQQDTLGVQGAEDMPISIRPSKSVTSLRWRPEVVIESVSQVKRAFAAASDDHSVRIYTFS